MPPWFVTYGYTRVAMLTVLAIHLFLSPWTGTWRIPSVPGRAESHHLLIRPDRTIELYTPDWTALEVHEARLEEPDLYIRYTTLGHTKNYHLRLKREGDKLDGTIEALLGQFRSKQPLGGVRVSPFLVPRPEVWNAKRRNGERVDILRFLEDSPRNSFQDFVMDWNSRIEPAFYPFLEKDLWGSENDRKSHDERLQPVFASLSGLATGRSLELEETWLETISQSESRREQAMLERATVRVFMPKIGEAGPRTFRLATEKIVTKPGERICCGDTGHRYEWFLFVPLEIPRKP